VIQKALQSGRGESLRALLDSLEDLAKLYSIDLKDFDPIPCTNIAESETTPPLAEIHKYAKATIAELAAEEGCVLVGCYSFVLMKYNSPPLNGEKNLIYIAEGIGLKPKKSTSPYHDPSQN